MRFSWLLVVTSLVATGCVRSQTTDCGHGVVCASGQVCVRATDAVIKCSSPERSADCRDAGRADGELCEDGSGRCYDGYCLPISCGDQLIDPTERCDDGNTVAQDGCSADCTSDEKCGTGVVDSLLGETCDDGNQFAHDGCTPRCTVENPRWTNLLPETPKIGAEAAIAYLPGRRRAIVIGGNADFAVGGFEWTGRGWLRVPDMFGPPPRSQHTMVYDPTRDVVVLTGGRSATRPYERNDTWEWSGSGWSIVSSAGPARALSAMAYDVRRKKMVMFGGEVSVGPSVAARADTWEWDGAAWTKISSGGGPNDPPARRGHVMAYDARIGKVVMFGGRNVQLLGDTWAWDGTTWARLATTGPSPRQGSVLAPDRSGLILYGGDDGSVKTDTWRWTGTWTQLTSAPPAASTAFATATTDIARGVIVMTGGNDGYTWEWDGARWLRIQPVAAPATEVADATYDPLRGEAIVVHTTSTSTVRDGTWASLAPAPAPVRSKAGLVYDTLRDRAVMFGGEDVLNAPLGDTWLLSRGTSPATWTQLVGAGPTRRTDIAMAYDVARGMAVLFGGRDPAQTVNDETWELDTAWHERTPGTVPVARSAAAMGYDPIRQRVVMFGGVGAGGRPFDDTWEWDGTEWTEMTTPPRPPPRGDGRLTWNAARRRLTLTGGDGRDLGTYDDTWEWDGRGWEQVAIQLRYSPRTNHHAFQTADGIMLFGGDSKSTFLADSWALSWVDSDAPYDSCAGHLDRDGDGKTGCADPECWAACTPLCGPGTSCAPTAPRCGDGAIAPQETCGSCAADVGACTMCGDLVCEGTETAATCPGDCP